jgi:hypothetical protein
MFDTVLTVGKPSRMTDAKKIQAHWVTVVIHSGYL